MDLKTAVMERTSRRKFELDPIDEDLLQQLESAVNECNKASGLNIKLRIDDGEAFSPAKSYGMLSGACNYFAMICKKDDPNGDEKIGYYGESLILLLTRLGLGSCWIGGTYDKDLCHIDIEDDEQFRLAIVFGFVKSKVSIKEKAIIKTVKRNCKEIKDMLNAYGTPPNWVVDGVRYAVKAPSAQNRQPVKFYCDGEDVNARVRGDKEFDMVDLGIAKLHFEIGAGGGSWEFGNGGMFTRKAADQK